MLAVELLQQRSGHRAPLRVVPLFETVDDLRNGGTDAAAAAVGAVVSRAHRGQQEVMIGYSDSAKDVGRLARRGSCTRRRRRLSRRAARTRRRAHVVPRPRRQRGPRRRADLSRHPVAAAGIGGRHDARHRTGRDDPGEVRAGDIAVRTLEVYTTATLDATLMMGRRRHIRRTRAHAGAARRTPAAPIAASSTTPALRRVLPQGHTGNRTDACSTSAAARRGATRRALASRVCAPFRGSSRGRRSDCCWRHGWAWKRRSGRRCERGEAEKLREMYATGRSSDRRST